MIKSWWISSATERGKYFLAHQVWEKTIAGRSNNPGNKCIKHHLIAKKKLLPVLVKSRVLEKREQELSQFQSHLEWFCTGSFFSWTSCLARELGRWAGVTAAAQLCWRAEGLEQKWTDEMLVKPTLMPWKVSPHTLSTAATKGPASALLVETAANLPVLSWNFPFLPFVFVLLGLKRKKRKC